MSSADQLLRQGIADYKAGQREQAARLFYQAVQTDPKHQMAWLWLTGCLDNDNEKRQCLERARDINPNNEAGKRAAQGLANLRSAPPEEEEIPFPDFTDTAPQRSAEAPGRAAASPAHPRPAEGHARRSEEVVICKGKYHWSMLIASVILAALCGFVGALFLLAPDIRMFGGILLLIGALFLLSGIMSYVSSEFVVTNKRILGKRGFINRTSLELLLTKAEAIHVSQGLLERLFGSGTITVVGSGGTKNSFGYMSNASQIRSTIQEQISIAQERTW
jgi:tetratricopeptide (TPR) repeat protein